MPTLKPRIWNIKTSNMEYFPPIFTLKYVIFSCIFADFGRCSLLKARVDDKMNIHMRGFTVLYFEEMAIFVL